jgi:hypothetical protein
LTVQNLHKLIQDIKTRDVPKEYNITELRLQQLEKSLILTLDPEITKPPMDKDEKNKPQEIQPEQTNEPRASPDIQTKKIVSQNTSNPYGYSAYTNEKEISCEDHDEICEQVRLLLKLKKMSDSNANLEEAERANKLLQERMKKSAESVLTSFYTYTEQTAKPGVARAYILNKDKPAQKLQRWMTVLGQACAELYSVGFCYDDKMANNERKFTFYGTEKDTIKCVIYFVALFNKCEKMGKDLSWKEGFSDEMLKIEKEIKTNIAGYNTTQIMDSIAAMKERAKRLLHLKFVKGCRFKRHCTGSSYDEGRTYAKKSKQSESKQLL